MDPVLIQGWRVVTRAESCGATGVMEEREREREIEVHCMRGRVVTIVERVFTLLSR